MPRGLVTPLSLLISKCPCNALAHWGGGAPHASEGLMYVPLKTVRRYTIGSMDAHQAATHCGVEKVAMRANGV